MARRAAYLQWGCLGTRGTCPPRWEVVWRRQSAPWAVWITGDDILPTGAPGGGGCSAAGPPSPPPSPRDLQRCLKVRPVGSGLRSAPGTASVYKMRLLADPYRSQITPRSCRAGTHVMPARAVRDFLMNEFQKHTLKNLISTFTSALMLGENQCSDGHLATGARGVVSGGPHCCPSDYTFVCGDAFP